jgi:hypothetical protein
MNFSRFKCLYIIIIITIFTILVTYWIAQVLSAPHVRDIRVFANFRAATILLIAEEDDIVQKLYVYVDDACSCHVDDACSCQIVGMLVVHVHVKL